MMHYSLFVVSFQAGIVSDNVHASLQKVRESAERLIQQENSSLEEGGLPSPTFLKKQLEKHGHYTGHLVNGTWLLIQKADDLPTKRKVIGLIRK